MSLRSVGGALRFRLEAKKETFYYNRNENMLLPQTSNL